MDIIRYGAFEIERIRELGNIWAGNELPKGSTVILALYTASNRLIGFEEAKFNGGKISFYTDKQYAHYKVMAWDALDGNLQPTCGVSRGESIEFD